jgi:hypothetical protein
MMHLATSLLVFSLVCFVAGARAKVLRDWNHPGMLRLWSVGWLGTALVITSVSLLR